MVFNCSRGFGAGTNRELSMVFAAADCVVPVYGDSFSKTRKLNAMPNPKRRGLL